MRLAARGRRPVELAGDRLPRADAQPRRRPRRAAALEVVHRRHRRRADAWRFGGVWHWLHVRGVLAAEQRARRPHRRLPGGHAPPPRHAQADPQRLCARRPRIYDSVRRRSKPLRSLTQLLASLPPPARPLQAPRPSRTGARRSAGACASPTATAAASTSYAPRRNRRSEMRAPSGLGLTCRPSRALSPPTATRRCTL